ncbi:MAG: hypothetical protein K9J77_11125 [Rhodoferax sp.]|nr:hypothetical protein [Rhodoferax sp.]
MNADLAMGLGPSLGNADHALERGTTAMLASPALAATVPVALMGPAAVSAQAPESLSRRKQRSAGNAEERVTFRELATNAMASVSSRFPARSAQDLVGIASKWNSIYQPKSCSKTKGKSMFRLIGILVGFGAIYAFIYGAMLVINKPVLEPTDLLIIGMALMIVSQLFIKAGTLAEPGQGDTNSAASSPEN